MIYKRVSIIFFSIRGDVSAIYTTFSALAAFMVLSKSSLHAMLFNCVTTTLFDSIAMVNY